MSKYAFDLDGTLDIPAIAQLARDLHAAGHEIHIVTGGLRDVGEWTMSARIEKLARLKVPYTEIHRCFGNNFGSIGREKGKCLAKLGAIMIFEDSPTYLNEIAIDCPNITRIFVTSEPNLEFNCRMKV